MKDISGILYNRGLHRSFGDPSLGTVSAFLSFIFLIRGAVNLYFVFDISSGSAVLDIEQISAGWFLQISLYIILCSSLSAFHLNFALPDISFINMSKQGKMFRLNFLKHAAFMRPVNILILVILSAGLYIFGSSTTVFNLFIPVITLALSIMLSTLAFKAADYITPGKLDIQILESVFLFLLVVVNPDVTGHNQTVALLYQGRYFNFDNPILIVVIIISAFSILIILLFLLRVFSWLNKRIKTGMTFKPLLGWYNRYFIPKYWFLLYILIFSILFLPVFSNSVKLQATIVFIIFNISSFLIFLNQCNNNLKEKWLTPLINKDYYKLIAQPVFIHSILSLTPVILFIIFL